jgi:hypothetical protein
MTYPLASLVEKSMQHYFLHVRSGDSRLEDPDGADFADIAAAKAEAIESARELISECVLTGLPMGLHRLFEITDDEGRLVASVPFSDAVMTG